MRRVTSILVLIALLALGSGAMEYWHNLSHARTPCCGKANHDDPHPSLPAHHDESACFVHTQLRLPAVATGWVPLLVFLGIFVAFVTELATPLVSQRLCFRLDCRGPPAC